MSAPRRRPGLDSEDAAQALDLVDDANREASSPFEWAVVRILVLIIHALKRSDT